MMQGNIVRQAALVVMLASAWSFYFFGPFWCDPNAFMFGTKGDVMKNYFTFCWHVKYDPSYVAFTGMNYPFGDQINYPDAQPFWSGIWRMVCSVWSSGAERSVGFENMLVLLGQPATALITFLLLKRLGAPVLLAIVCAIGAMALEPQTSRISGHFGLSYAYAFPLLLWLYLRARENARARSASAWLGSVSLILFWIHPYLGFVPWSFLVLLFAVDVALGWEQRERGRVLSMALGLALPIIVFLLVQRITDHHLERTTHPLGYFEYQTKWGNLFWPYDQMVSPLHQALFGPHGDQTYEGIAYLGLATMITLPMALVVGLVQVVLRKRREAWVIDPLLLRMLLPAGALLFFAMGYPFNWDQQPLLWKIPWVSQFRSAGRFAWPMFWVLFLFAVLAAERIRKATAGTSWKAAGWSAVAVVTGLPLYEGFHHYHDISVNIGTPPNLFRYESLSTEQRDLVDYARNQSGYSAIVPLPWYHVGSDEYLVIAPAETEELSMMMAWYTGLPIMANLLPKVSLQETRISLNAMGPPWYGRPMAAMVAPDAQFLVLATSGELPEADEVIHERSRPLKTFGKLAFRSISASRLFADERSALFARAAEQHPEPISALTSDSLPAGVMLYRSYDDQPARHTRHGSGALQLPEMHQVVLFTYPPNTLRQGSEYVATFWNHTRGPLSCQTLVTISEDDTAAHTLQWRSNMDLRGARTHDGEWCMMEFPFAITDSTHAHSLVLARTDWYSDTIWVDELLVRRKGLDVFAIGMQDPAHRELFYNGHWLKEP